jgi:hypothetical protein
MQLLFREPWDERFQPNLEGRGCFDSSVVTRSVPYNHPEERFEVMTYLNVSCLSHPGGR